MDTSEQRILMSDCGEIQAHRPIELFAKYYCKDIPMVRGSYELTNCEGEWFASSPIVLDRKKMKQIKEVIWLPQQDRLQAMVFTKIHRFPYHWLASRFGKWADEWSIDNEDEDDVAKGCLDEEGDEKTHRQLRLDLTSMEQLWLAYVMRTLYQKIWSGTEWVKE